MKIRYRTTESLIIITGINPLTGEQIEIKAPKNGLIDFEKLTSNQIDLLKECYAWIATTCDPLPENILQRLLNVIQN